MITAALYVKPNLDPVAALIKAIVLTLVVMLVAAAVAVVVVTFWALLVKLAVGALVIGAYALWSYPRVARK